MLVVIADIDVRAKLNGAGHSAVSSPTKMRKSVVLPHAVGADQRHAVARAQMQAEVLEELPAIVALAQIFWRSAHPRPCGGAPRREKRTLSSFTGFFQAHDFFQPLFAAFPPP